MAATVIVGTVDIVLLLRVYVLYQKSKKILSFLIPLVCCEVITMVFISVFSDLPSKTFVRFGNTLNGCYALSVPSLLTFYPTPALAAVSLCPVPSLGRN
jgi:hypothetical protein